jgi:hypothetical protein
MRGAHLGNALRANTLLPISNICLIPHFRRRTILLDDYRRRLVILAVEMVLDLDL